MKDSAATMSPPIARVASASPAPFPSVEPSFGDGTSAIHGQRFSRVIEPEINAAEAALQAGQWQEALDDAQAAERKQGITVFDTKTINHFKAYAHLKLHDNSAALTDFERVLATGIATPEEVASISRTVSALRAHAESNGDVLAQREAEAPPQEAESIAHLDEAYVYLGLAEQKLGNIAEARRAFARLKNVPNVSPKILRLWTLYADTVASQEQSADSVPASRDRD
jgi:tetratricopeptide (TPR) repeat protein